MTLQQIRYIFEISRCGSISKAAQVLCLTQPYLSSILKDLERELHIIIFDRARKGVTLTQEGKEFLHYAKSLLEQEERILDLYSRHAEKPQISFSLSLQRYSFVIKAFFQFYAANTPKQFEIHLRECGIERVIRDVFDGKSELGVISLSTSTETFIRKYLAVRDIEFNEIMKFTPRVFFRKTHPMASHEEIDIEHMQIYPFASFESDASVPIDFSEEAFLPKVSTMQCRFFVIDRATMMNTLLHTDAFSIGTGVLSDGFAGPQLVSRPIKNCSEEIILGWLQSTNAKISDKASLFIQEIKKVLGEEIASGNSREN